MRRKAALRSSSPIASTLDLYEEPIVKERKRRMESAARNAILFRPVSCKILGFFGTRARLPYKLKRGGHKYTTGLYRLCVCP
jgi:hypothetical protein